MTALELQKLFLPALAPEDFFILLAYATQKEKVFLLTHPEYGLGTADETIARDFFERRIRHEPIASIIGHKEFYGYDFKVTKDTLIPRPETELLVELTLKAIGSNEGSLISFFDIGTGSGCILVSVVNTLVEKLPSFYPRIKFFGTDISLPALAVAKENAMTHRVAKYITFLEGDLLAPCLPYMNQNREIIVTANLPYLSEILYSVAPEDVRDYEPKSSLFSNKNGLDHYFRLLDESVDFFKQKKDVTLFLEISPEQKLLLEARVRKQYPRANVRIHQDLAGKDRVVEMHLA